MRQILYGIAVASLGLAVVVTLPTRLELCVLPADAAGW